LEAQARKDGGSVESLIIKAVAHFLETPLHTFFQVSTSRSLVAGQYAGAITCAKLLEHGDFGLGTFAGLAGEMVIVDGQAFRVDGSGRISQARPSDEVPFATVTRLNPSVNGTLEAIHSYDNLKGQLDRFRRTDNLFYAIRIDGRFSSVKTRAVSPPKPGATLLEAAQEQHEFEFRDSEGTFGRSPRSGRALPRKPPARMGHPSIRSASSPSCRKFWTPMSLFASTWDLSIFGSLAISTASVPARS
jgi:acetolactate decarboxylase